MTHEAETHAHPIRDVLAVLRRHGRLPDGPSETLRRIESLPASEHEAALVREGFVSEEDVAQTVALDAGLPCPTIHAADLSPEVVTGILPAPYARKNAICALSRDGDQVTVAVANPYRRDAIKELERTLGIEVRVVVATRSEISGVNGSLYNLKTSLVAAATELEDESAGIPDAPAGSWELVSAADDESDLTPTTRPVVSALDSILRQALEHRASDIHMEPKRDHAAVRFRVDGVLHDMHRFPRIVYLAVVSRLKMLSGLDIAEKRRPQDGRFKRVEPDKEIEFRVSTMPTVFGEKAVLRIFDPEAAVATLDQMRLLPDERDRLETILGRREGLALVTGPTGSGKTTTLYSVLRRLATPEVNVISIEDPVEMVHPQLSQVQVNPKIRLSFAAAIRSVLRQDPDIVMVGEIRDGETAEMAVQAALTGHLVLSTLHTNDAASTATRLADFGVPPFLIASTLIGVVAQRLVRVVCDRCAAPAVVAPAEARRLGDPSLAGRRTRRGAGCARCRQSGYRGRRGVFEILPIDAEAAGAIARGATAGEIARGARRRGLPGLRETAIRHLLAGETTALEVLRVTGEAVPPGSGAGGPGENEDHARDDVEHAHHVRDGEQAATDRETGEPAGAGERNPADRRDRIHDQDADEVEEQVDDRDLESPVGVRAGDRERREERGQGRAHVRAEGHREGVLQQQQPGAGEGHEGRGRDRAGLDHHGGERPDAHGDDRALAEDAVDGLAGAGAGEALQRAHEEHQADHEERRGEQREHAPRGGTGARDLAREPGERRGDEGDHVPERIREGSPRAHESAEAARDRAGEPREEPGEDLQRKQDQHGEQVEDVVASGHLEGPADRVGVVHVGEGDERVRDGRADVGPHDHRDRALERERGRGRGDERHDEGARDRGALDQRRGEDSGEESRDRVLEGDEESVEKAAAESLEAFPEPVDPPEKEEEEARYGERPQALAAGESGRGQRRGESGEGERPPGPTVFEFED